MTIMMFDNSKYETISFDVASSHFPHDEQKYREEAVRRCKGKVRQMTAESSC